MTRRTTGRLGERPRDSARAARAPDPHQPATGPPGGVQPGLDRPDDAALAGAARRWSPRCCRRAPCPDVLGGVTYVGLVPFVMRGVRIFGTPPLPYLSGFAETNVRLYAVDGAGPARRGVPQPRGRPAAAGRGGAGVVPAAVPVGADACAARRRHGVVRDPPAVARAAWCRRPRPRAHRGAGGGGRAVAVPHRPVGAVLHLVRRADRVRAGGPPGVAAAPGRAAGAVGRPGARRRAAPAARATPHVLWSPGVRVRIGRPRPLV